MALTKTDLDEIKKLLVETVGPMFESQNKDIDDVHSTTNNLQSQLEKFRIETRDHFKSQDYELERIKEFCKILEGKEKALQNDVIEILDRVTSIEKRLLHLAESDIESTRREHAGLVAWAKQVSAKTGIPLEAK